MNNKITNPEFVKRMVVDGENLTMSREKFFKGEILTPEEITKIINTIPFHKEITWGNNRLSMLPWTGIEHLHQCIIDTVKRNVPGDFIETGAWRGGACIVAKSIYNDLKTDKKVFVADSFEGLPPPNIEKYPDDIKDTHYLDQNMKASLEDVQESFKKFNLLDDNIIFLKGWFKDTLPKAPIEKISILRLDGDMYESTIDALKNLYYKLSIGGYCIIDDYYHLACRHAIYDFRLAHNIKEKIKKVDDDPRNEIHFWIKEKEIIYSHKNYAQKGLAKIASNLDDYISFIASKVKCKVKQIFKS